MKREQVPQEWMALFRATWAGSMGDVRAALAAVAPLIAAQERERCADHLDAEEHYIAAAAIRALVDATDTAPAPTRNAAHPGNAASPRPK